MATLPTMDTTSLQLVEQGSTPSSPAAGKQRLFVRSSDHLLCTVDSSGTVTPWGGALTNPMSGPGDLIRGGTAGAPTRLADAGNVNKVLHGGNASAPSWSQIAIADLLDAAIDGLLPWRVLIVPQISTPDATTGTWGAAGTGATDSAVKYPFYVPGSTANSGGAGIFQNTSAAQNDAASWNVVLAKGTWSINVWVRKAASRGIITVNLDGSSQGTLDTYAAANAVATLSLTGLSVATTGKKVLQFLMATKNASSSGYTLDLFGIELQRTA